MNAGLVGDVGRLFSWALKCFISVGGFYAHFQFKKYYCKKHFKAWGMQKGGCIDKKEHATDFINKYRGFIGL